MSKAMGRALLIAFVLLDAVLVVGVIRHVNRTPPPADIAVGAAAPSAAPSAANNAQTDFRFRPARA